MATSLTQKIWIPTKDSSWELGELVSFDENSGKVVAEGSAGVQTFDKSEVHRTDPSHFLDSDDLCSMNQLHEAPLMDCLRRRFLENKIYTNTGDVLISVNPYKAIRGLYDNMLSYLDIPDDAEVSSAAKPPHLFKVANLALMELVFGKKATSRSSVSRNQSIVVSGESGAGKTEASKRVMSFLIEADHDLTVSANSSQRASLKLGDRIRKVLMESNIILEAFGNAKTVRNDNSSRFGKYIKLQYDLESRIVSAYTETFLLEKSRLVAIGTGERNYHVFYQLLRGCKDKELLSKLKLQSPEQYKLLTDEQGEAVESPDDKNFVELHSAMLTLGTTPEEMQHIWSIIAALLHLSNFQYKTTGEGPVGIESPTMAIPEICEILGISPEMFVMRLTTQIIKVSNRSSVTTKVLNAHDVNNNVMALIKWVYSSLFAWLVRKINYSHCTMTTANVVAEKFIGILDIFGFEILQTNSFEQLCINYTNERLQQQFNEFVFEREQEEYAAEGLDWTSISYKDNQHVIDLISKKPMGLLVILEGQGMLNRTDDDSALISSFNSAHDKKSLAYERSRFADSTFSVRHFAGIVTYTVKGFLEKNNDSLQEDLMELLVFSDSRFVQNAIIASDTSSQVSEEPGYVGEIPANMLVVTAGKLTASTRDTSAAKNHAKAVGRRASLMVMDTTSKKLASTVTVSFQFRGQLDLLIATLRATSPHYVKCIKPNSDKQPLQFDSAMVLEQLKYSGALEVVRIRQEGFPISMPFQAFYETFELLGFERKWKKYAMCTMEDTKSYATELCTELLIPHKDYQLGHTKVYLREDSYEKLHQAIAAFYNSKAVVIQAFARRWKTRGNYKKAVKGAQMLQALARMKSQRKQFKVILHNKREQERIEAERIAAELEKLRLEQERIRLEEERYREEQEKIRAEQERLRQEELQRLAELEEVRRQEEENRLRLQAEYEARIVSLHTACEVGDFDLVKQLLLQNPDDFEQPDPTRDHRTVLQSAILGGNESLIQYLCPSVSDLNAKDMHGNSAIHYALRSKSKQKLTFLKFLTDLVEPYVFMDNLRKGIAVRPLQNSLPDVPDSDNLKYRSTLVGNIFSVEKSMELAAAKSLSARKSTVSTGSILKAGWLSKKGESQQWRKRWMVLTPDSLMYFRNNKDKIPRDSLSFSTKNEIQVLRLEENDSAIEIVINHQSMRKKRSRISFMADNETEILEWMNLIMAAAGVEPKPIRKPTGDILSLHTSSPAIKEGVLSSVNKAHDTPLHMLSQIVPETTMTVSEREELLCIAAWMVENGSPLATFNGKGFTVLHEALANGHFHLALFLAGKGSPPNFTSKKVSPDEKKVLDVAAQLGGASEEFLARLKFAFANYEFGHGTFHDPPARLRGFHYLTIGFKKHSVCLPEQFVEVDNTEMFQIQVGLFSKHHEEIESKQIAVSPTVLMSGNAAEQSLLWLQYWHMQHPLDNISNGSYIVVEYTKKPFANAKPEECTLLSWLTYTIDHSTINSDIVVMTWNAPPFKEKYVAQHQHGMGMLRRKSQGSELDERGSEAIPTSSTIELEIVINKRNVHEEELF